MRNETFSQCQSIYEITKEERVTSPWRRLADITSILISKGTGQNHTPSEDAMRKPQGHFWLFLLTMHNHEEMSDKFLLV